MKNPFSLWRTVWLLTLLAAFPLARAGDKNFQSLAATRNEKFSMSFAITPQTRWPESFPPNCTENVWVVNDELASCSPPIPAPHPVAIAEENEGGYSVIGTQETDKYPRGAAADFIPAQVIATMDSVALYSAHTVITRPTKEYPEEAISRINMHLPVPYADLADNSKTLPAHLKMTDGAATLMAQFAPLQMHKLEGKYSRARFIVDYALIFYQGDKIIYAIYIDEYMDYYSIQKTEENKKYFIFTPQSQNFYLYDDQEKILHTFLAPFFNNREREVCCHLRAYPQKNGVAYGYF